MANKQIVDARGLSCPQPVLMTKKRSKAEKNPMRSWLTMVPQEKMSPVLLLMQVSRYLSPKMATIIV